MSAPVLQFKRGNAGVAGTVPALRPGEPAISLNNFDFFIGIDTSVVNNKFFGSHRYWGREDGTNSLRLKLVDRNGTNSINLKSPDTLAGVVTYTLPATPTADYFLKTGADGTLSWAVAPGQTGSFSGITTFADGTDNTLGNADTGAVQIDGGLGVNKNVTVGGNLNVQGYSNFIGVVTFQGGTINLGDSNTDNINVSGEFISNLTPNSTNTYDVGISTQQWRDAYFAGIGSFANLRLLNFLYDSANSSGTSGQFLTATGTGIGWTTIAGVAAGTISTATRAQTVDTVQRSVNAEHYLTFVTDDNASVTAEAVYTDAGITYNPSTNNLTLTGDLSLNGGDVATSAATFNLINSTATNVNFGGAATALSMGATTGIATINNATLTLPNATTVNVNGANPTIAGSSTGTLSLFNANLTGVNAFQAATNIVLAATTGITTVRNKLVVSGNLEVDGNNIQASDGNNNITLTSNTLTTFAGDIRVNGNDIQASDGNTNITLTSNTLTTFAGDVRVNGNDIQSSTGANALTLSGSDVTVVGDLTVNGNDIKSSTGTPLSLSGNDVTVNGNLFVSGSTTQVNTAALTVEDRTIDLGVVNGAAPSSATTWDLGILFNYHQTTARKSAVIWEHGDTRFKFASVIGSDTDGTDNNTPQLTVTTFAPIEIGSLWVTDCAGTSQVISCTGTTRNLENITIDAGTF